MSFYAIDVADRRTHASTQVDINPHALASLAEAAGVPDGVKFIFRITDERPGEMAYARPVDQSTIIIKARVPPDPDVMSRVFFDTLNRLLAYCVISFRQFAVDCNGDNFWMNFNKEQFESEAANFAVGLPEAWEVLS